MPSNPPTVNDLEVEAATCCAVALAEAGVYLRGVGEGGLAVTPLIRFGLRRGAKDVGLYLPNPLVLQDSDVARLSPFAIEWVIDWGQVVPLEVAIAQWHLATRRYQDPVEAQPTQGGWLMDEKRAVERYVSTVRGRLARGWKEPADPIAVVNVDPFRLTGPGGRFCPTSPDGEPGWPAWAPGGYDGRYGWGGPWGGGPWL